MSARAEWYASYRAHRAAKTLWYFMTSGKDFDGVPSFVLAVDGWEAFDFTRNWGDQLGVFPLFKSSHRCRMSFDRVQPRLPA